MALSISAARDILDRMLRNGRLDTDELEALRVASAVLGDVLHADVAKYLDRHPGVNNPVRVRFLADDPAGLWKKGDEAHDWGPESGDYEVPLIVLRLLRTNEVITLTDPYDRGLIEEV